MPKFKLHHVLSVVVGVVVVGSLVYINTASYFSTEPAEPGNPTAPISVGKNPLLSATKRDVGNWFPGTCFAEIYMKNPSYKGGLIAGCIDKTSKEIKAETGATLGADDFRTPEVLTHFKSVYGASNPWRT